MTSAARAVRSEKIAQTPNPRRVACDPEQPTAIPRDPDRDLVLSDRAQKVLKAILDGVAPDKRLRGTRRWCAWMSDETLLDYLAARGQSKHRSYLHRGFDELIDAGRILRFNMTGFDRWLLEDAPRRGMSSERPAALRKCRGRVIVVVAELPPVVAEVYGPLRLPPPDEAIGRPELGRNAPPVETCVRPELGRVNRSEIPMDSPDSGTNSSSTCVCDPPGGATTTGEVSDPRDGEELLSDQFREWLRYPLLRWERRMAENALRDAVANRDGAPVLQARPTTFVENPAAGRERSVVAPSATTTDPRLSSDDDAPGGRISRPTADRLARDVRALRPGDHDQADRIVVGLLSALDANHDAGLAGVYSDAIHMARSGRLADAVADAIRQAPNGGNPRGLLFKLFNGLLRAGKNPPPGYSPKSSGGGRHSSPAHSL